MARFNVTLSLGEQEGEERQYISRTFDTAEMDTEDILDIISGMLDFIDFEDEEENA